MMDMFLVKKMNEKNMLYEVLHIPPVCNQDTVYCAFLDPSSYRCTVMFPHDEKSLVFFDYRTIS